MVAFQGKGYVNTTGMSGKEARDFYGSKSGTYHNIDASIQRVFFGGS